MSFDFYMPTQVISGRNAVAAHADKFALGKKALIVCGKNSARASGALDDVNAVLASLGITSVIFDKIVENPPVSVAYEGGQIAAKEGVDFIVAIGGGSPIDASKAVAAYATNPGIEPLELFGAKLSSALPIIAIPTTAGTGSEVDAFSVLTLDGQNIKKTYRGADSYPRYAILDPKYTESLNLDYTVSTALDAFCHCVESYLSPKSTEISRMFALEGARRIYPALKSAEKIPDSADSLEMMKPLRYGLLTGACAGGIAINTTGTGFNHPLGYNLTMYKGIPHGRACGAFMEQYFAYNSRSDLGKKLIGEFCSALGERPETVAADVVRWSDVRIGGGYGNPLDPGEIDLFVENVKGAGNYANSPYVINIVEMADIYHELFS